MNTIVNAAQRRYPQNFPWRNTCSTPTVGWYDSSNGELHDLQNAEEGYYRNMTVLDGLKNSINTATFASAAQLDLCGIQKIVDAVGLHGGLPTRDKETNAVVDPNPKVTMTTLGNLLGSTQTAPLTMASAFATFANDGKYCAPIAITSVTDQTGAQLPAQSSSLPGCRQARGGPRRELRAPAGPERGLRFAHPAADFHPDHLPDRRQDRNVQQQRLHLGGRPHHGPGDGGLVR